MVCFKHPPTDTFMLFSLKAPNTMLVFNPPRIFFFSARAGVVGLVWGFCALLDLKLSQTLRKPISKAIRQSDIRQFDNRPYTKKQLKPINPKQDKAKPGPPSHGETTMARTNGMSRCRRTCPRNIAFQLTEASLGLQSNVN